MKDFIQITKDDVLFRLMNGEEVYAYELHVTKNGNVTPVTKRLKNETLAVITTLINADNVVLFVRKTKEA